VDGPQIWSAQYGEMKFLKRLPKMEKIKDLFYVRFEVFTAVTMKNGVFWDIKTQFVLHRRHLTSPLQSQAS
jgi:hypothetical protein